MTLAALTQEARLLLNEGGYRVGTVRKWKAGDFRKTDSGWELVPTVSQTKKTKSKKPKPSSAPPPAILPPAALKAKPLKVPLAVPSSKKSDEFKKQLKQFADALASVEPSSEKKPKPGGKSIVHYDPDGNEIKPPPTKNEKAQADIRRGLETLLNDFGLSTAFKPAWKKWGDEDKSNRYRIKSGKPYGSKSIRGSHDYRTNKIRIAQDVHNKAVEFIEMVSSPAFRPKAMSAEELDAANAFRTLVHEQIHGTNVLPPESYRGLGVAWEEALTELSARKVMVDTFGLDSKDMHDVGSYSEYIRAVRKGVQQARLANGLPDLDYPSFFLYLSEAALATRRDTKDVRGGDLALFDYKERFTDNLAVPEDWDETQAQNYRADAWDFIEEWFKKTAWFKAENP